MNRIGTNDNPNDFDYEKLHTSIAFPDELDCTRWNGTQLPLCYKLKAFIAHDGDAHFGHYWSMIRKADGGWVKFNDQIVEPTTRTDEKFAYMLLYEMHVHEIEIDACPGS